MSPTADTSRSPSPAPQPARTQAPAAVPASDTTVRTLRTGTLLAAVILFFLPWLEFRCQGAQAFYQTGFDTLASTFHEGEAAPSPLPGLAGWNQLVPENDRALAVMAAFGLTAAAFLASLTRGGGGTASDLALVAFGCLLYQTIRGFPFEVALKPVIASGQERTLEDWRALLGAASPASEAAAAELQKTLNGSAITTTVWLYVELALLALAALMRLLVSRFRDRPVPQS